MNITQFWQLIDDTRFQANGDSFLQANLLEEALVNMSLEDILDFDFIHIGLMNRAYRADLWDAAYLIESCGDDSFDDFRAWLIAQGAEVYEQVLMNPETLAEIVSMEQHTQVESLLFVAPKAYGRKTNDADMPRFVLTVPELDGAFAKDGAKRFPRLYDKFRRPYDNLE